MKTITHRIHMNTNVRPLTEILRDIRASNAQGGLKTATASADADLNKVANLDNLGDKKAPAFVKGDEKAEDCDEKVEDCDDDDKDCDEEVKGDEKCDDDEEAKCDDDVKVAECDDKEVECYDAGKVEGELVGKMKSEDGEASCDKKGKATKKKKSLPSSGQAEWEGKPENNNNPVMPSDVVASSGEALKAAFAKLENGRFVKIAKLTPELKKRTKDYWRSVYGEDYANAMVEDQ